ncbi:MAG: hypothetical protein MI923_15630 [Phycisphaerales bacterium]|nr:hypothetical protein [Phycisphaerales bacterium]
MKTLLLIARVIYLVFFVGLGVFGSLWVYSVRHQLGTSWILCWVMSVALGLSGIALSWFYPRKVSKSANACYFCGYDLTGLVENRCPECGRYFIPPAHDDGEE